MIHQSDSIAALAAALAKAQATIEGARKDSENAAFKNGGKVSRYADLAAVWAACREQLTAEGLSVVQFPGELIDNRMTMATQLCHASGEWMRATLSIPLSKVDAQGYGSAVTYARRYALAAVVGVCPDDDDGNAATGAGQSRQEPQRDQSPPARVAEGFTVATLSDDQFSMIQTMAEKSGTSARDICDKAGVTAVKLMPADMFDAAMKWMEKRLLAKAKPNGNGAAGPQTSELLSDDIPY